MTRDEIQAWVSEAAGKAAAEAVADALKTANLIDGPTHLRHHQLIEDFCDTFGKVKTASITVVVAAIITGIITVVILGIRSWLAGGK